MTSKESSVIVVSISITSPRLTIHQTDYTTSICYLIGPLARYKNPQPLSYQNISEFHTLTEAAKLKTFTIQSSKSNFFSFNLNLHTACTKINCCHFQNIQYLDKVLAQLKSSTTSCCADVHSRGHGNLKSISKIGCKSGCSSR